MNFSGLWKHVLLLWHDCVQLHWKLRIYLKSDLIIHAARKCTWPAALTFVSYQSNIYEFFNTFCPKRVRGRRCWTCRLKLFEAKTVFLHLCSGLRACSSLAASSANLKSPGRNAFILATVACTQQAMIWHLWKCWRRRNSQKGFWEVCWTLVFV